MSNLQREVDVKINKNDYTVKFPNTGQMMDIDIMKVRLSSSQYDLLKFSVNPLFQRSALKIDAIAFFSTMLPELKKDLNTKSLFDLTEEQMNEVLYAYEETILPWLEEWLTVIMAPKKDEEKKDNEQ